MSAVEAEGCLPYEPDARPTQTRLDSAPAAAMLVVRGLSVRYGTTRAVLDLSLDVAAGEAVALLGPNGAGKTSTLHAISGLIGHGGTVAFDGRDLTGHAPEAIARLGLIHVPEGRRVFPTLTVRENLAMGRIAAAGRTGWTEADVLDLFPALGPLLGRAGYALSGGEQQMVALGRALLSVPRLLVLDEPSLGLAPAVVRTVYDALARIAADVPMLVVEQNTAEALRLCVRGHVLAAGRLALTGTAAELGDRDSLLASYLGRRDAAA
ncbi:ABC transporter ATP-binding protein [Embleya sp. NBC_00896]|uniref:ABC transporter ATP-binding protein n=1 Tax=Embleya sp. NBC_00896 TaxID=2975961 RepID=UPI00386F7D30|nr:ABC transporter ATP-binding protein [Embleya sp. NBC_00896]